jgi:hypothetical protein
VIVHCVGAAEQRRHPGGLQRSLDIGRLRYSSVTRLMNVWLVRAQQIFSTPFCVRNNSRQRCRRPPER